MKTFTLSFSRAPEQGDDTIWPVYYDLDVDTTSASKAKKLGKLVEAAENYHAFPQGPTCLFRGIMTEDMKQDWNARISLA